MRLNKILLILVVVLVLALLVFWVPKWFRDSGYSAVYLRTGDLYFGKLVTFPYFGLKNVYNIQVNSQNQQNPLSIQKFSSVFWGPEDFLKINRDQVVWVTGLNKNGQLAELLRTNPSLTPATPPSE